VCDFTLFLTFVMYRNVPGRE